MYFTGGRQGQEQVADGGRTRRVYDGSRASRAEGVVRAVRVGGGERGCAGGPRSGLATHSQEGGLLVRSDIVRPGPPLWPDPMIPRESPARCYWRACEAPGASHLPRGRSPGHEGSLFGACVPVSCSSGTTRNFYFLFSISFSLLPWRLVFVSFPPPEVTRVQHHKESHPP